MVKILVRVYARFNVGDDLFLHILFTRYPEVDFLLIAPVEYDYFIRKYHNVVLVKSPDFSILEKVFYKFASSVGVQCMRDRLELHLWKSFFKRCSTKCDGYIYIGGSIFMQQTRGLVLNNIINNIVPNYFPHSFIIGANWGPQLEDSFLAYHQKEVMPRYEGICFRDSASYELFKELKNTSYAPDVVFQYKQQPVKKTTNSIGFSVMDFSKRKNLKHYWEVYLSKTCDAITKLHTEGYEIHLFSFCKDEGDENAIEEIKKNLSKAVEVHIHLYKGNLQEYLAEYAQMETMVAVRFHSLVLSLIFEQKICPLVYSNKVSNILADLNYKEKAANISDLELVNLYDLIKSSESLPIDLNEYRLNAQQQFAAFDDFLTKALG